MTQAPMSTDFIEFSRHNELGNVFLRYLLLNNQDNNLKKAFGIYYKNHGRRDTAKDVMDTIYKAQREYYAGNSTNSTLLLETLGLKEKSEDKDNQNIESVLKEFFKSKNIHFTSGYALRYYCHPKKDITYSAARSVLEEYAQDDTQKDTGHKINGYDFGI